MVLLGAVFLVLVLSYVIHAKSPGAVLDFIPNYNAARTLIRHADPYDEEQVLRTYRAEGGERSLADPLERAVATRYIYPPSALVVMFPFALLPWGPAHVLWPLISASLFILAAYLVLDLSAALAPVLCGALIGYMLANSQILVTLSNPSELAIALCIIAVWCFIRNRFGLIGVLCLALSLAIKPQGSGLIWLYFLLAGGTYRKRALQSLLAAFVFSAPFFLWVWTVSPHWFHELQSNILAFSQKGGNNDPGPTAPMSVELVNLQVVFSRFYDVAAFYNIISYLIFLPPFIAWCLTTLRAKVTSERTILALAAITPLSLLPVYHHLYDAKLILLLMPALALLWTRRDRFAQTHARTALLLTASSIFFTGDISNWLVHRLALTFNPSPGTTAAWFSNALQVFPSPLILLATGLFYLWAYRRAALATSHSAPQPAA